MSTYLLGVYNSGSDSFQTVSKCSGIDDATLEKLNRELDMTKISMNMAKVPSWLNVHKSLVPDFVVKDPKVCIGLLFLLLVAICKINCKGSWT